VTTVALIVLAVFLASSGALLGLAVGAYVGLRLGEWAIDPLRELARRRGRERDEARQAADAWRERALALHRELLERDVWE
jgi:hypothetical protein